MVDNLAPGDKEKHGANEKQDDVAHPDQAAESTHGTNENKESSRQKHEAWGKLKGAFKATRTWLNSRKPDFYIAWATIIMVGTTTVYTYYARKQWKEMHDAGAQTDQLICLYRQQLEQLQKQATDTHTLAETAYINARPWIVVSATGFQFRDSANGIQPLRATIIVTDTGPTPAQNVRILGCGAAMEHEPRVRDYAADNRSCIQQVGGFIGKDIPLGFNQDDTTNTVTRDRFAESTHDPGWHYYVWGTVTYDISPMDVDRTTNFCLLSGPDRAQMGACKTGNYGN
jgi:hypothetical protein